MLLGHIGEVRLTVGLLIIHVGFGSELARSLVCRRRRGSGLSRWLACEGAAADLLGRSDLGAEERMLLSGGRLVQ